MQQKQRGFTLLEIMVVIVILGILASLVVPNLMGNKDQADHQKAVSDIVALENALDMYKLDNTRYPTTDQGLNALITKPDSDPAPKNYKDGGYIKRLPADPWQKAQALSWLFFEQYSHEPYIAVARFICGWTPADSPRRAGLPVLRQCGHAALAVMERHLAANPWFTGSDYGIADVALYAYTCVAPHGGIALDAYPALRDWLSRVEATPGFVPLPAPEPAAQALIDNSI